MLKVKGNCLTLKNYRILRGIIIYYWMILVEEVAGELLMEGLWLLIMVLQEKSWKDIINLFKYKAEYYILYSAIVCNNAIREYTKT